MTRLRTRWFAVLGATLLAALSAATALGAHPETDSAKYRGLQVAAFHPLAHGLDAFHEELRAARHEALDDEIPGAVEGGDEQGPQPPRERDERGAAEMATDATEPAPQGSCVSEVARSGGVGGAHANHGGAVSDAARNGCRQAAPEAGDEGDGTAPPTEVSDGPGNSDVRGSHGRGHPKS